MWNAIKPIQRPSVGEQVCDQMKEYLLEGRWKPGEKLPSENELAQAFGVSRVTIREALLRLVSLGLLETKFGGGTYVKEITPGLCINSIIPAAYFEPETTLEVIEYRQVVVIKTAGLAARRAKPSDVAELQRIYEHMQKVTADPEAYAGADLSFHLELAKITGNSLLIETLNVIRSVLSQAMFYSIQKKGYEKGLMFHKLLIDAMKHNDEERAMQIMTDHLNDLYATMEKIIKESKDESKA